MSILEINNQVELAYLSVSEISHRTKPKVYTEGFEYTFYPWYSLHEVTEKYSYSTMIFNGGHRLKENVVGYGNIFIFDIDGKPDKPSYTVQQVIAAVKGLKSLVVSTRSHTIDNHRLRLILLADKVMNKKVTSELYEMIMHTIIEFCGLDAEMLDKSCFSIDRQYAPNPINQKQYYVEGELLPMEFIVELAQKKVAENISVEPMVKIKNYNNGNLKQKRSFIKERLSFELMAETLKERGLTVKKDGSIVVPGNPTDALHINRKTGLLSDFANDTSYDPVSVLHDYYKVPLKDATNYIYEKLGGHHG